MMKVLYPIPVTERLPRKNVHVTFKFKNSNSTIFACCTGEATEYGEIIYNSESENEYSINEFECWYSDQPPPEIENTIEEIKHAIDVRPKNGSEYNHIELTIESAQTLLQTLKAE